MFNDNSIFFNFPIYFPLGVYNVKIEIIKILKYIFYSGIKYFLKVLKTSKIKYLNSIRNT